MINVHQLSVGTIVQNCDSREREREREGTWRGEILLIVTIKLFFAVKIALW